MIIESQKVAIPQTKKNIIDFVTQVENFKQLMPDSVAKFEVTAEKSFRFALSGMPEFELKITDINDVGIKFNSASEKTPFQLDLHLKQLSENQTEGQFIFEGAFNPMMAMMIKKPIGNFLEVLITKLSQL